MSLSDGDHDDPDGDIFVEEEVESDFFLDSQNNLTYDNVTELDVEEGNRDSDDGEDRVIDVDMGDEDHNSDVGEEFPQ